MAPDGWMDPRTCTPSSWPQMLVGWTSGLVFVGTSVPATVKATQQPPFLGFRAFPTYTVTPPTASHTQVHPQYARASQTTSNDHSTPLQDCTAARPEEPASTSPHRNGCLSPEDRGEPIRTVPVKGEDKSVPLPADRGEWEQVQSSGSVVMDLVQNTVISSVLRSQGLEVQSIRLQIVVVMMRAVRQTGNWPKPMHSIRSLCVQLADRTSDHRDCHCHDAGFVKFSVVRDTLFLVCDARGNTGRSLTTRLTWLAQRKASKPSTSSLKDLIVFPVGHGVIVPTFRPTRTTSTSCLRSSMRECRNCTILHSVRSSLSSAQEQADLKV